MVQRSFTLWTASNAFSIHSFGALWKTLDDATSPHHLLPMPEQTWTKKYRWVQTWPEEKEDWSAFHDGLYIGRVSRDRTSLKKGTFMWSGGCSEWWGFQRSMPHSGRTVEAWEAAKAVEDWYDEGLARSGPRPASVAANIGPLDEDGLPLWLRG